MEFFGGAVGGGGGGGRFLSLWRRWLLSRSSLSDLSSSSSDMHRPNSLRNLAVRFSLCRSRSVGAAFHLTSCEAVPVGAVTVLVVMPGKEVATIPVLFFELPMMSLLTSAAASPRWVVLSTSLFPSSLVSLSSSTAGNDRDKGRMGERLRSGEESTALAQEVLAGDAAEGELRGSCVMLAEGRVTGLGAQEPLVSARGAPEAPGGGGRGGGDWSRGPFAPLVSLSLLTLFRLRYSKIDNFLFTGAALACNADLMDLSQSSCCSLSRSDSPSSESSCCGGGVEGGVQGPRTLALDVRSGLASLSGLRSCPILHDSGVLGLSGISEDSSGLVGAGPSGVLGPLGSKAL